jgi:hypothetical protein
VLAKAVLLRAAQPFDLALGEALVVDDRGMVATSPVSPCLGHLG